MRLEGGEKVGRPLAQGQTGLSEEKSVERLTSLSGALPRKMNDVQKILKKLLTKGGTIC